MSRKKHRTQRRRRHSRRVGAISLKSKDAGLKLLSLAGGFFMGSAINGAIDAAYTKFTKPATTTTTTAATAVVIPNTPIAIGEVGIGGLLLMRKKTGTVNTILKVGGGVLAGAGVRRLLTSMGVLSGYQSVPVIGRHRMAGYQSVPVIGSTPAQLSGRPAQLQGYLPAGSGVGAYIPAGSGVMGSCEPGSGLSGASGSGYMG